MGVAVCTLHTAYTLSRQLQLSLRSNIASSLKQGGAADCFTVHSLYLCGTKRPSRHFSGASGSPLVPFGLHISLYYTIPYHTYALLRPYPATSQLASGHLRHIAWIQIRSRQPTKDSGGSSFDITRLVINNQAGRIG